MSCVVLRESTGRQAAHAIKKLVVNGLAIRQEDNPQCTPGGPKNRTMRHGCGGMRQPAMKSIPAWKKR